MTGSRSLWMALVLATMFAGMAWAQDELLCPTCGKKFANGARFCPDDGAKLAPAGEKCPQCGNAREGSARFCQFCGHDYSKPPAVQPTPNPNPAPAGERVCTKCGKKALPGTKFCSGCRALLPPEGASGGSGGPEPTPDANGEIRQWVESVVQATSQLGPKGFSAAQIVGPPDVKAGGKDGKAWCPSMARRGIESITVHFARPVIPRAVRIYETASQGFVTRIDALVDGREEIFWEAEDRANPQAAILEAVSKAIDRPIDTLKITLDSKKNRGLTEIDAVELAGSAPGTRNRDGVERVPPRQPDPVPAPGGGAAFATPDDCFDAWKQAILDRDARTLAACYVGTESRSIVADPAVAEGIFNRYGEALAKAQYSIDSRRAENPGAVWIVDIRVKEEYWTRRTKETFRFQREGNGWRLQIERGD